MGSIVLKPGLFHRLVKTDENEIFEVYEFSPSLLKAFPFLLEKISLPYRIRCIQEYFVGYKVYFLRKDDTWGGYCIVSNGRNARYPFCTGKDITFGRYFIVPELRGREMAVKLISWVLNNPDLQYENAYAYVHAGNKASHATLRKLGAVPVCRFDKVGTFRKIVMNDNGKYTVYRYQR